MIRGIGVDIVKVDRINEKNVQKILSQKEKEIYDTFKGQKRKKEYAAGRFAVKESLIKCFKRFIPYSQIT
ncbi:4'-phosphopantetheinyl transferase superfamily protein, partial [Petrotoga halophila]